MEPVSLSASAVCDIFSLGQLPLDHLAMYYGHRYPRRQPPVVAHLTPHLRRIALRELNLDLRSRCMRLLDAYLLPSSLPLSADTAVARLSRDVWRRVPHAREDWSYHRVRLTWQPWISIRKITRKYSSRVKAQRLTTYRNSAREREMHQDQFRVIYFKAESSIFLSIPTFTSNGIFNSSLCKRKLFPVAFFKFLISSRNYFNNFKIFIRNREEFFMSCKIYLSYL